MKFLTSRKGFTLIELLVVIGILAVLAAIAIPSVAGLIDRANVSADKTNANEMTNAVERFTSEYELYCQDIASGVIKDENGDGKPDGDLDSAQGRVYNVTGAVSRANITALESTGLGTKAINRDTKYPVNNETLQAIVENYTKTSSATFEPKQSDCSFYYSPICGVVVCAENGSSIEKLNNLILSGKDAKGNELTNNATWFNVTNNSIVLEDGGESAVPENPTVETITFSINLYQNGTLEQTYTYVCEANSTWKQWIETSELYNGDFSMTNMENDSLIWGGGFMVYNENRSGCPSIYDLITPNENYEVHNNGDY